MPHACRRDGAHGCPVHMQSSTSVEPIGGYTSSPVCNPACGAGAERRFGRIADCASHLTMRRRRSRGGLD
jgi:hypothetical protein